jgi:hypothetical protein
MDSLGKNSSRRGRLKMEFQRRKNGYQQSKEMRSSKLLVHGNGWKILQRAV